jgi:serine/threonine protein kinase
MLKGAVCDNDDYLVFQTANKLNTSVRLIDIGSAAAAGHSVNNRLISTRHYRAPEVILGKYCTRRRHRTSFLS